MKVNCDCCGKEFDKQPAQIKKSKSGKHFCSRSCAAKVNNVGKTRNKAREFECKNCGKTYTRKNGWSSQVFCSTDCRGEYYSPERVEERRQRKQDNMREESRKTCSKCGVDKPLTEFGKNRKNKDGRQNYCKACANEYARSYHKKNRGKILQYKKEYHEENRDRIAAYRQESKDWIAARSRAYREANKEKILARERAYRKSEKGREVSRLRIHRRRARLKEATVEHFSYDDLKIFWLGQNILEDSCYYCGKEMPDGPEHIDHYIPLAKGGTHEPVNLKPSCASCNISKSDKMPEEFLSERSGD